MSRGDTVRWRGVLAEDRTGRGLTVAQLRQFVDDAEELARWEGADIELARPLVAVSSGGAIRHIWLGVARRSWLRWFPEG
jgi:hypothetical protein